MQGAPIGNNNVDEQQGTQTLKKIMCKICILVCVLVSVCIIAGAITGGVLGSRCNDDTVIKNVPVFTTDTRQLVTANNALTEDCHNELQIAFAEESEEESEEQDTSIYVKNCSDFRPHQQNASHQSPSELKVHKPFTILENSFNLSSLCSPGCKIDVALNLSTDTDNNVFMCYFNNPDDASAFRKDWRAAKKKAIHCWSENITANTSDTYHPDPFGVTVESYYFVLLAATAEISVQYRVELINQTYFDPSDYSLPDCRLGALTSSCTVALNGSIAGEVCVLAHATSNNWYGFSSYDVQFRKG